MTTHDILIVEDEQPIREMLAFALSRSGFVVRQTGAAARAQAELDPRPDLVVIDWMLPGMSGLDLIRTLKADRRTRSIPVIMLTARSSEHDTVIGLESGADDYLTKPFSPKELVARIRARLRSRKAVLDDDDQVEINGLRLDSASQRVSFGEDLLQLSPAEYRLLELLMKNPDRAYTRSQLLDAAWGSAVYVDDRTIDVNVRRLRIVLERVRCDHLLQTIRGVGYRFSARAPE